MQAKTVVDIQPDVNDWLNEQALRIARCVLSSTNLSPDFVRSAYPRPSLVDRELVRRLSGLVR